MNSLHRLAPMLALALMTLARPQDPIRPTSANNDFAFGLMRQLGSGNQIVSPHSIRTAFAMCIAGTDGATKEEIAQVLGLAGGAAAHAAIAKMQATLDAANSDKLELRTANRLWGNNRDGYFEQPFLDFAREQYGAGLGHVNFGQPDAARALINRWVSERTTGKIPELLPDRSITPRTVMVMTNAIYFLGAWENQFDEDRTRKMPFHLNAKDDVLVPFMRRVGSYEVATTQGCTALALPYKGGKLRMLVMLPDGELTAFRKQLTAASYARLRAALKPQPRALAMPRFRLQQHYALHEKTLPAMGMRAPFKLSHDWTPLNGDKEELCISGVFHSAVIDVNEVGTEAAAATAVVLSKRSLPAPLRIDRPFAFTIEHTETGQILFAGQVANPGRQEQ